MRTTLPNKYADTVLSAFAQFNITEINEFELTPSQRRKLYRKLLGLSDAGIKYSTWGGKCGRKRLYSSPEAADAQRIDLDKDDETLIVYLCPYWPRQHWHIGHVI